MSERRRSKRAFARCSSAGSADVHGRGVVGVHGRGAVGDAVSASLTLASHPSRWLAAACIACALAGCAAYAPPKPWEKGDLARPSMRFDTDPLAAKLTQHVYQSKEGAAGGSTVGGGGCGCN
jgi:uncharacterized protein DUF4266